ncbi:hypothetical protein VP01_5390g2 [Puccinia sorghi]|uniref:Uncharacterized protein n=1 Tax=Puccinia sorghi TaxID=27349 RepID=A0A0L6UJU8_9BASI|nr:hypothetical protein VP01_5390g2 [Puccinia sorghi]
MTTPINLILVFLETLSIYIWRSFIASIFPKYNKDFLVFIDPENPNCYFPLTFGTVQTWAQALVSQLLENLLGNGMDGRSPNESNGNQSLTVPSKTDARGNYLKSIKIQNNKQEGI